MRLWLLIMLMIFPAAQAAPITLDCSLYNSDDSLSVSLDGENLGFSSSAIIEPHSMLYQNKGSSNQPDCDYSYSISLNEKPLASGASTDSGEFAWSAKASSGDYALGSEILSLSARHMVDDGVLSSYFATSEHEVTDEIETDGASYSEAFQLDQDSMNSKGKGYTTMPEFSYSFEQTVDGQSLGSGAESDSGAAKWSFSIRPDSLEDGSGKTSVSAETGVEDGYLKSTYFNPNIKVDEEIAVDGAAFFQKASIDMAQLDSTGNGVTHEEESSSEDDADNSDLDQNYLEENSADDPSEIGSGTRIIKDSLSISSADKSGSIEAGLTGDTKALWHSGVSSNPKEYSFSMLVNGQGTIEDMDEFGMEGEASGLPAQTLPTGTVDISYDYPREDFQDHLELTEEEIRDFCEDYGLTTPGPSLWYYLQQKSYLYPYEIPIDSEWASLPEDYYRMSMAFTLKNG